MPRRQTKDPSWTAFSEASDKALSALDEMTEALFSAFVAEDVDDWERYITNAETQIKNLTREVKAELTRINRRD